MSSNYFVLSLFSLRRITALWLPNFVQVGFFPLLFFPVHPSTLRGSRGLSLNILLRGLKVLKGGSDSPSNVILFGFSVSSSFTLCCLLIRDSGRHFWEGCFFPHQSRNCRFLTVGLSATMLRGFSQGQTVPQREHKFVLSGDISP